MRFTHKLEIFEIELERAFSSLSACQSRLLILGTRVNVRGKSLASFNPNCLRRHVSGTSRIASMRILDGPMRSYSGKYETN